MENGRVEKNTSNSSKTVIGQPNGAAGKTMPAVPVLQKQEVSDEEPAQSEPASVLKLDHAPRQLKPFPQQPRATNQNKSRQVEPFQFKAENNTGLPDNLKSGIESMSGFSLNDVNVHYNSDKPAQLQALAYAQGTDIHVGPGQEKHVPHEAWHVVQQKQGRVQPTIQMKQGVPVNDDPGLEHEADVMGAKALEKNSETPVQTKPDSTQNIAFVQLKTDALLRPKLITADTPLLSESLAADASETNMGISTAQTVQALMSFERFKANTDLGEKRKAIADIDAALIAYHQLMEGAVADQGAARTAELAAIRTLKTEVENYLANKRRSDPQNRRIAPVNNLLTEITATEATFADPALSAVNVQAEIDARPNDAATLTAILRTPISLLKQLAPNFIAATNAANRAAALEGLQNNNKLRYLIDAAFVDAPGLAIVQTFLRGRNLTADQRGVIDLFVEKVTTLATMKELMSQRFDIPLADIKGLEVGQPTAGDAPVAAETDWDIPGLKRAYGVQKALPDGHASSNASLARLKRFTGTGGWHGANTMAIGYNNLDFNKPDNRTRTDKLTFRGNDVFKGKNYFDATVRHEVGHAVDDAHNLSAAYCVGNAAGGNWTSFATATDLVRDYYTASPTNLSRHARFNGGAMFNIGEMVDGTHPPATVKTNLRNYMQAAFGNNPNHPDLVNLVNNDPGLAALTNAALKLPWESTTSPNVAGRTYVFSNVQNMSSYATSARARQVSNYQFRAPKEWFAEAYAAFYTPNANGVGKGEKLQAADPATFLYMTNTVDRAL